MPNLRVFESAAGPWEGTDVSACIWCGAAIAPDAPRSRYFVECQSCHAGTTSPSPTNEALARAYEKYRPESGRFLGPGDAILKRTRSTLAKRIDDIAPPGPVLDVGSGDGTLLDSLSRVGRKATGLERHSERPDVIESNILDVGGTWAAVVFWHSLEHLREPRAAIRRAIELLEPHGLLIVALPNLSSLQAQAFGDRWFALDVPRHLAHLPANALLSGLEHDGLNIERKSYVRGGQILFGWLHGLVGRLPGALDLQLALRKPDARYEEISPAGQIAALTGAVVMLAPALVASVIEYAIRRGGTLYVEARRA
jgi:SAM-dependent methyltransferase